MSSLFDDITGPAYGDILSRMARGQTWETLSESNSEIEGDVNELIGKAHGALDTKSTEAEVRSITNRIFDRMRDLRDRFHYDEREMSQKFSERVHNLLGKCQANRMNIFLPDDEPEKPRWINMLPRKPHI